MKLRSITVTLLFWSLFCLASGHLLGTEAVYAALSITGAARSENDRQVAFGVSHAAGHVNGELSTAVNTDRANVSAAPAWPGASGSSNGSLVGGLLMGILGLIVLAELIRRRLIG